MKVNTLFLTLALISVSVVPVNSFARNKKDAKEKDRKEIGLSIEVGADVVSSYLWRGQNLGGVSIQPSVTVDWRGLYVTGWANIGAENWTFEDLAPEMDITIGYSNYGLELDLTHLYYFGGEPFFPKGGFKPQMEEVSSSQMEAHAGFHLGELIESVPLSVDWYTTIFGNDCYINDAGEWQRAWSTYVEVGYQFNLLLGITLDARVGFTPWRGMYSFYEEVWKNAKTVAINNIHLRAERDFTVKGLSLGVWAECMLNCYGIDKTNFTTELTRKFEQRFNWSIGGCLYLESNW